MRQKLVLFFVAATLVCGQTLDPWAVLEQGLKDPNPVKRISALIPMSVIRPQTKPVAMIEAMLDDKDYGVRQQACATLGDMKSRTSIPRLRTALDDKAPEVVFAAAKALYAMGDPMGVAVLSEVLVGDQKDSSNFISSSIRDAKLKLHDPRALLLIGVNQAAGLLGPFGAGVPIAEQLLKDGQASGKTVAALLLATDTSEESKAAVKLALGDKNWTVRAAAARAAALRELTDFYDDIAVGLDDKRDEVRYACAAAAIRLKQTPAKRAINRRKLPVKK